jgi:hypothetical protein
MAHLLGVASLVLGESGHVSPLVVTEDMVIAALPHDAVEDEEGLPRLRDIEAKFGNKVAKIVEGCTDSFVEYPDKKQDGKSANLSTSNGYGTSHLRPYWSPLRTNCTTLAQFWRSTDKSAQRSGVGSSEDANSSCGIPMN